MSDAKDTIGITELLDEVSRDLDDFRKKHPGDYSVKNVTLWWETEKERLTMRHSSSTLVKNSRREERMKRLAIWFLVAWNITLSVNTVASLLR